MCCVLTQCVAFLEQCVAFLNKCVLLMLLIINALAFFATHATHWLGSEEHIWKLEKLFALRFFENKVLQALRCPFRSLFIGIRTVHI